MDKNKNVYTMLDRHREGCDISAVLRITETTNPVSAADGADRNNSEIELGPTLRGIKHTKISSLV
jgi:hypothetical protein